MKDWKKEVDKLIERFVNRYFPHDKKMKDCVEKHPLTLLIASLPFLAESKKPEMYAALNLGILVNGTMMNEYFRHRKGDPLKARVLPLNNFDSPQRMDVIKKAFLILELMSLEDHRKDALEDKKKGIPNPINDDGLDYDKEKKRLLKGIEKIHEPEIDRLIPPDFIARCDDPFWFCEPGFRLKR